MAKILLLCAAISGLLSVVIGAFGAHGLKGKITSELLAAYQTGVHYQMFHTVALLLLALLILRLNTSSLFLNATGLLWLIGIILFSGSLYYLALGGPSWLGPITPLGGLLLILGWLSFTIGIAKSSFISL